MDRRLARAKRIDETDETDATTTTRLEADRMRQLLLSATSGRAAATASELQAVLEEAIEARTVVAYYRDHGVVLRAPALAALDQYARERGLTREEAAGALLERFAQGMNSDSKGL